LVLESQLSEAGGDLLPHQFQRYFVFISSRYSTLTTSVFLLLKGDSYPSFLFLLLSTEKIGRMFLRNSIRANLYQVFVVFWGLESPRGRKYRAVLDLY
jgi:hypothetical protein